MNGGRGHIAEGKESVERRTARGDCVTTARSTRAPNGIAGFVLANGAMCSIQSSEGKTQKNKSLLTSIQQIAS